MARRKRLEALLHEARTLVFYEAPHRVQDMLEDCAHVFGESRGATVVREITKMHETAYRGSLGEHLARAASDPDFSRGEIVLVIAGSPQAEEAGERGADGFGGALDRVLNILLAELPLKQAAHLAAQLSPSPRERGLPAGAQAQTGIHLAFIAGSAYRALKSRPGSRCPSPRKRARMEESPGSRGHGAR